MENQDLNKSVSKEGTPSPPPPEILIRTMESDIKAIQEGGGELLAGKPEAQIEGLPSAAAKKEDLIFTPTSIISERPQFQKQPEIIQPAKTPFIKKPTVLIIGTLFVAGLGFAAGYYFIFPSIIPQETPPDSITESPPEVPAAAHQSFFFIPADKVEKIRFAAVDLTAIKSALTELSQDNSPANTFKEVIFQTAQKPVSFQLFLQEVLPDFPLKTADFFEEDFTGFLYYNDKGAWPGYIAKLKSEIIIITAQTQTKQIESSTELKNFFIQSPGPTDTKGFQNGEVSGKPIRYLVFPGSGLTLSYGLFTNFVDSKAVHYLAISASPRGLEEALKRLLK